MDISLPLSRANRAEIIKCIIEERIDRFEDDYSRDHIIENAHADVDGMTDEELVNYFLSDYSYEASDLIRVLGSLGLEVVIEEFPW